MNKKLVNKILLIAALIILILSAWNISFSGFLLALLSIVVFFVYIIYFTFYKLTNKIRIKKATYYFLIGEVGLIFAILTNLVSPYPKINKPNSNISQKIHSLYYTDQYDRKTLKTYLFKKKSNLVSKRDSLRLRIANKVYLKYINDSIKLNPKEKFRLAMIFHHGKDSTDYKKAHDLAKTAYVEDSTIQNGKWLKKATYDRLQMSLGKPQEYGTQNSGD